ncbi:MAG: PQQ-dependent dehydrogenase, methanol/ethanol family [Myxococcota bacterium]
MIAARLFRLGAGFASLALAALVACESAPPADPGAARPGDAGQPSRVARPSDTELRQADRATGEWLSHGRTDHEQRFSPLDQIDVENVGELGLAWATPTGTTRGMEATPLVMDGVLYVSGAWSIVLALDARTGELLWRFDPKVPGRAGAHTCCDVVNRGVALYAGRVYVGTLDGRLIALDAKTGRPVWESQTTDPAQDYAITGAPRVVRGKVIIGNGGADLGLRGYVSAYDAEDGHLVWRFYTVPGDPAKPQESMALERALPTWQGGEWWKLGGGGTVWDALAYDPELELLYVGTGNGGPWTQSARSGGDNLYLASILALRPDTGELVWHYQTTPGEIWDYGATQPMILADLELGGRVRKVLMQAPKNGFFYVLDRATGELLSAEPFVPVTWAEKVDLATGRPIEAANARYAQDPVLLRPGAAGGHNWHPMSFHPRTGLVYLPAIDMPYGYVEDRPFTVEPGFFNTGADPVKGSETMTTAGRIQASLLAWDPVRGRVAWRVDHAFFANGGTLATAGDLVFQGTGDGRMRAYRAQDGELVWETPTGTGVVAPPISYAVDGEQYLAVVTGLGGGMGLASGNPPPAVLASGNAGHVLAWKLGGKAKLPEPVALPTPPLEPIAEKLEPARVEQGRKLYIRYCGHCHGPFAIAGGMIPDLRRSAPATYEVLPSIVLEGAREARGMPRFDGVLDATELAAIRQYLLDRRAALVAETARN